MAQLIRKIITSAKVPKPLAPYNQAIVIDRTVYCSGMIALDKNTMKIVPGGAAAEAKVALGYIRDLLEACGSGIDRVVKATVLLADMNDFGAVNEEYKAVMGPNFPCRTCYQAAKLPVGATVEIEIIAYTGDVKTELVTV